MTSVDPILFGFSVAAYFASTLAGLVDRREDPRAGRVSILLALLGAGASGTWAVWRLGQGGTWAWNFALPGFTTIAQGPTELQVALGPLGAVFLLLEAVVGGAVLLASLGYLREHVEERRGPLAGLVGLFLLSMMFVVSAGSVFLFLVAWEGMTVVSYFLVVHEHGSWEVRRSGLFYLVMSHAAAAGVLTSLVLLAVGSGSWTFSGMAPAAAHLGGWWTGAIFVAALLGFGTKAGLAPLHVWLPEAHPAAPSNVSALMSGVMIKMGVYGLVLVAFETLGGAVELWWGFVLLVLGALSCLLGVLNAIAQHDLKRLLAFHSVENIGIIFMALGVALVFLALGQPALAGLGLLAGLFHTWNHALFKALLFLGAGAAVGATRTRDMERMGGLARAMPGTALLFLGGAMAISALPPFNGFVSEWLLFQALFASFTTGSIATELAFTAAAGALALASGLAGYCFVKAFGVTFLARPRTAKAAAVAHDAPATMRGAMATLLGLCLVLGVAPFLLLGPLSVPVAELVGSGSINYGANGLFGELPRPGADGGSLAIGVVALLLALGILVAWALRRSRPLAAARTGPAWDCGMDASSARMEYSASGYAQPILRLFASFYQAHSHTEPETVGSARAGVLARTGRYEVEVEYPLVEEFFGPLAHGVERLGRRVSRLQSGGIHAYLGYMVLTLVVLLIALRVAGGGAP